MCVGLCRARWTPFRFVFARGRIGDSGGVCPCQGGDSLLVGLRWLSLKLWLRNPATNCDKECAQGACAFVRTLVRLNHEWGMSKRWLIFITVACTGWQVQGHRPSSCAHSSNKAGWGGMTHSVKPFSASLEIQILLWCNEFNLFNLVYAPFWELGAFGDRPCDC